jgi:hypothetical protein
MFIVNPLFFFYAKIRAWVVFDHLLGYCVPGTVFEAWKILTFHIHNISEEKIVYPLAVDEKRG